MCFKKYLFSKIKNEKKKRLEFFKNLMNASFFICISILEIILDFLIIPVYLLVNYAFLKQIYQKEQSLKQKLARGDA